MKSKIASNSAYKAKTRGEMLNRVASGEQAIITRHDKAVARLLPEGLGSLAETRKAAKGLLALRARIAKRLKKSDTLTEAEVRAAIDEGRL